MPLNIGLSVV